ncbi:MAG: hypothetical protein FWE15_20110 [Actinomycetia bacterium]|nr:hypothetical protein [Actinomycetes bacterium]
MSSNGPVRHARVSPALWEAALRQAGGDARRLRVVSETEVIVSNARPGGEPEPRRTPPGQRRTLTVADVQEQLAALDPALPVGDDLGDRRLVGVTAADRDGTKYAALELGPWIHRTGDMR